MWKSISQRAKSNRRLCCTQEKLQSSLWLIDFHPKTESEAINIIDHSPFYLREIKLIASIISDGGRWTEMLVAIKSQ